MASHHRKLLNESDVDPNIAKICEKYCDTDENPEQICPFECIDFCPPVCKIPPPPPVIVFSGPPEKSHRLSLLLTVSLAVLSAVFILFIFYTIYKFCSSLNSWRRRRRRASQRQEGGPDNFIDEDHGPVVDHHVWYIRTIGLQPSVIGAITLVKYKKGDGLIDGTDCSVCLSEFQEDETLRLLPKCSHAFHVWCIDTWLRSHTNCPMCRAGIVNTSASLLPPQEQIVQNSGLDPAGDSRRQGLLGSGMRREVERVESENEIPELRIGIPDHTVSRARVRLKMDENANGDDPRGLNAILSMRRSVSADSLSALVNAFPVLSDRNSDNHSVEVKESASGVVAMRAGFINQSLLRLIGSDSIQTGPSSMKRSLSCNANVKRQR
ncbi:hypothetical protein OROGR_031382 [Orobanche gracilis]